VTDLDRETDVTVEILARHIRQIGDADPDAVARAFMMLLRSRGWRPVIDLPPPLTGPAGHGGSGLPKAADVRALLDQARHDSAAATAAVRKDDPPRGNVA
jgi:hypothetical protein